MEIRWPPIVKGMVSFVVPAFRTTHHTVAESTASAEYCYSVFLRHFSHLACHTAGNLPRVVAELGPGSSIGTMLAAVIAGSERCVALDVENHTQPENNLRIFDELVALFRDRRPVPGRDSLIATEPTSWEFPRSLEPGLSQALAPQRIASVRDDVLALSGKYVGLVAPWNTDTFLAPQSIDWILSHSVMEHVERAEDAYRCCAAWLAPGGYMTHEIDYGSHGLTKHWNGHWAIPRHVWRLAKGARPFLINRLSHGDHVAMIERNGMQILEDRRVRRSDGLGKEEFVTPFKAMSDDDAKTHVAFIACRAA